ncbi:MAG: 30S ribosomal protein S19e [Candidatus Hodarchaeales archaeon]
MTTGFVIPASILIERIGTELKEKSIITKPEEFNFVKTSHAKENMPENPDWFYIRAGSIMRKMYFKGTVGVQELRKLYSSPKNRGARPEKSIKSGGKIIRNILQQMEKEGLVSKVDQGRKLSPKGISFVDKLADELKPNIPELEHY